MLFELWFDLSFKLYYDAGFEPGLLLPKLICFSWLSYFPFKNEMESSDVPDASFSVSGRERVLCSEIAILGSPSPLTLLFTSMILFLGESSLLIYKSASFVYFCFISDFGEYLLLYWKLFCLYPCLVKNLIYWFRFMFIRFKPLSKAEIPPSEPFVPVWFVQWLFSFALIGDVDTLAFFFIVSRCILFTPCNTLVWRTWLMKSTLSSFWSDISI